MRRAPALEDMSLQEVCAQYTWHKGEWQKRRKDTHTVVRVYPRYSPNPEDPRYDEYCCTKVIFHHPFRDLNNLKLTNGEEKTWPEIFAECRVSGHIHANDTLRSWEEESRGNDEEEDEDEAVNPDISAMEEADWQAWARDHPNAEIPAYDTSDLGRRPIDDGWDLEASYARWNDVPAMSVWIDERKREAGQHQQTDTGAPIDPNTLEDEQRLIYNKYVEAYTKIIAGEDAQRVLINVDGTAGCGKTYLIRSVCQKLRQMAEDNGLPDPIRVLAPSGVAALNIHGRTLHSALGIPITVFSRLVGSRLATLQLQWKGVHFIIIDEKSMVGLRLLAQTDSRLRQIFPQAADQPFGGVSVALFGDFAQLPPVGDTPLYSPPSTAATDNGTMSREGGTVYHLFSDSLTG